MKTILTFFLFLTSGSILSSNINQRIIEELIFQLGSGKVNRQMARVLAQKPESVIYLKEAHDLANQYSVEFCKVQGQSRRTRDEVDAIRHFIGASILSAYYGNDYARKILTSHEGDADDYNDENRMDLKNNEIGIRSGHRLKVITLPLRNGIKIKKLISSKSTIYNIVFEKLDLGQLKTLESKDSYCSRPSLYPNM